MALNLYKISSSINYMVILKKIGVISLAKLYSVFMFAIGFFIGLSFSFISYLAKSSFVPGPPPNMAVYSAIGFWALLIFPVLYGIIGFIAGAIGALLYNLVAKSVGGLELEFDKK